MRLADLATFRQAAYRLFGGVLLYPEEGRLGALRTAARRLQRQSQSLVGFAFYHQWRRFLGVLGAPPGGDRSGLEGDYTRLFLTNVDGICPPFASHYLEPGPPAQVMAEIEGEYGRAGLTLAPGLDEPPDHAAVELEYLSFLCGHEARAWRARQLREGADKLQAEARFLARYVCPWFPEFAQRIAAREAGGFYAVAAGTVGAFIQHDRDLVAALLDRCRGEAGDAA